MNQYFITLMVIFIGACKSSASKQGSEQDACLSKGKEYRWNGIACLKISQGSITKNDCLQIVGATWDSIHYSCQTPKQTTDCKKVDSNLIWNGVVCDKGGKPPNFFQICMDPDASEAARHTLAVMSRAYVKNDASPSCQEVFTSLFELNHLAYHNEQLSDLTPFQGLTNLNSLDLWNNEIVDIRPLEFVPNLTSLQLGHNRIESIEALGKLTLLQHLNVAENKINAVNPLADLRFLKFLDISSNQISDISSLDQNQFVLGFVFDGNPLP